MEQRIIARYYSVIMSAVFQSSWSSPVLLNIRPGWWECVCYVLIFCLEHFFVKTAKLFFGEKTSRLGCIICKDIDSLVQMSGCGEVWAEPKPWVSFWIQNLFWISSLHNKRKNVLMFWQLHSIVSDLFLAFRTSYSFLSCWLLVAWSKSVQQTTESYFILLHGIAFGT